MENDTDMRLTSLESLSLNDTVSATLTCETTETSETIGPCQAQQQMIQDKLEIADVGLSILISEAQRLKRILKEMEEMENEEDSYTNMGTDTDRSRSTIRSTDHDDDGTSSAVSNDSDVETLQGCCGCLIRK